MTNLSTQVMSNTNETSSKGFIKQLMDGDFSLAKTYWLYGVLGSVVMNLLLIFPMMSGSLSLIIVAGLISVAYAVIVLTAIWNSASKHTGSKFWSVMAKIIVVFNSLYLLSSVVLLFSI
jgi:hypothetical protein